MGVPISQVWAVTTYVLGNKIRGVKRFPLVLMLEPLFRCNLTCQGCGKIQYPAEVLKKHLTPEQCFKAAEECGAPIVSIPGGEPLLHPQIAQIVAGLNARKKFVYLCTNALLLEKNLHLFKPNKRLILAVHVDGQGKDHDAAVRLEGAYERVVSAIKAAIKSGFRVTTNTTLFEGTPPENYCKLFDEMMALGVEGMMISPGYSYEKAAMQDRFLRRQKTTELFRFILNGHKKRWKFNLSPLFLEFLKGNIEFECTPWGTPTYNLFGWQRPCYLLDDGGYAKSFKELMEETQWEKYGHKNGNERCLDCMLHCGYEPSAVNETLGSFRGVIKTIRAGLKH